MFASSHHIQVCLIGETHSKLQGIPFGMVSWKYPTNMTPTAKPCVMLFQPFFQTTLKFSVVWVTQCAITNTIIMENHFL
jgi:hypothetical protein